MKHLTIVKGKVSITLKMMIVGTGRGDKLQTAFNNF
jgi:hypothetical protein